MPYFEIPVALIVNDTVVVEADTADHALAVVGAAGNDGIIGLHKFMGEQGFQAGPADVDALQINGTPTEVVD